MTVPYLNGAYQNGVSNGTTNGCSHRAKVVQKFGGEPTLAARETGRQTLINVFQARALANSPKTL